MTELNYKSISGIVLLVILISATGTTLYLKETNNYENCRGNWILQDSGQYKCSKNNNLQWCYKVEDRGSGWYRCHIGEIFNQEKIRSTNFEDNSDLSDYTISPDGKTCYLKGNLRRGIKCESI